jgi:NAD(P)-dependent dehydrogenase (short-subunit alcohol dehydrogenase family)
MMIAKKFIPRFMHISSQSSFTITGGVAVYRPPTGWALTSIAVGALNGAVLSLAIETKPVRVNAVVPGTIDTELFDHTFPEAREMWKSKTLLGALGKPENTAEAYLYIMKDNFITGSMIDTNGGCLLV